MILFLNPFLSSADSHRNYLIIINNFYFTTPFRYVEQQVKNEKRVIASE